MTKEIFAIGNWKMHKTAREAVDAVEHLAPQVEGCSTKVLLAVPFTSIEPAAKAARSTSIQIGAQNMHDARDGAFTGETSALMLKEAGASFVLLGHSERRHLFGETNAFIHRKLVRALQDDLRPVLCIGETAKEREEGKTESVLEEQISSALRGIPAEDAAKIILAYEPVWAIGTGKTATPAQAEKAHAFCRSRLPKTDRIPILYGGSVKPENIHALILQKEIDGVLVGGSSLDPASFAKIVHACEKRNSR